MNGYKNVIKKTRSLLRVVTGPWYVFVIERLMNALRGIGDLKMNINDLLVVKLEEVSLLYKKVDDCHYFIGNDAWTAGFVVAGENYEATKEQASIQVRIFLETVWKVSQGEWEID